MWKTGPITAILMIACLLLSAQGYAQITLSHKNALLKNIFRDIEEQTNYTFFYQRSLLQQARRVTIEVRNASIEEVLDLCISQQSLRYVIVERGISILPGSVKKDSAAASPDLRIVRGVVINENDEPVPGTTITIKRNNKPVAVATNEQGVFMLAGVRAGDTIFVTNIGYGSQEVIADGKNEMKIRLQNKSSELSDVSVVHSGYNTQSRRRSTGSFAVVDNKLFNRRVSTNILDRLEGVTSGLILNKNILPGINQPEISIRGRTTIFANPNSLIVLDNFPYVGVVDNINPNDVESITVLKDPAAAAVWGAFAGNGVIVVTTKKGKLNQPIKVSMNSNITIGGKPDLYYKPYLKSEDQVEMEKYLFDKGFYRNMENSQLRTVLSPLVEILIKKRDGLLPAEEAEAAIQLLREHDVRTEIDKYFYRKSIEQRYGINLRGGGTHHHYFFSAGYDKDLNNLVGNQSNRLTLNAANTYHLPKQKLELQTRIFFSSSRTETKNNFLAGINYPYLKLADDHNNALSIPFGFRQTYKDTAGRGLLLDWNYRPLDESRQPGDVVKQTEFRINLALKYNFLKGLDASILYQFTRSIVESVRFKSQESYFTRDLINQYTQVSPTGIVTRPIPLGGIVDLGNITDRAHNIRGQLNYNRTWGQHILTTIAGTELSSGQGQIRSNRLYGYDNIRQSSSLVDYQSLFPLYQTPFARVKIPFPFTTPNKMTTANYISWYMNALYTWRERYGLSFSARKDESNIFGVKTNQKGVPLWSAGANWIISGEEFYKLAWLPFLKLRVTHGYSGNVDRNLSAYTVASIDGRNNYGAITADINNPPNPSLRWEKIRMVNIGLDFATRNDRITGSLEYYFRKGKDLIGFSAIDPTTGNSTFKGNTSSMGGRGADIVLNTKNIDKRFKWQSTVLFSYAFDKVTEYYDRENSIALYYNGELLNPLSQRPVHAIYSLKWAGLDPQTGDPQGYLDGKISKEYGNIINSTNFNDLQYHGPTNPSLFGSILNTFSWKQVELSFNITWKAGYYFRRTSIQYQDYFFGYSSHSDLTKRWRQPGDEKITNVPSLIYPADFSRDHFYKYTDVLVEKGDHIRLQDIRLTYVLDKQRIKKLPAQKMELYLYLNNIGLLWSASKQGIDPDYIFSTPTLRTFSVGVSVDF